MSRLDFVNDNIKKHPITESLVKVKDFSKKLDGEVLEFTRIYTEYILKYLTAPRQPQIFSIKTIEKDLGIKKNSRVEHLGRVIYQELTVGKKILTPTGSVKRTVQYVVNKPMREYIVKNPNYLYNIINEAVIKKMKEKGLNKADNYNSLSADYVVYDEFHEQEGTGNASRDDLNRQLAQYLNGFVGSPLVDLQDVALHSDRQSMESLIGWISDVARESDDAIPEE